MNWLQWVTFGIAVVGATLGIFNAWWAVRKDMVRLRVRTRGIVTNTGMVSAAVEVINLGYIPVTIAEIGFMSGRFAKEKMVITEDVLRRVNLPHRMEPRTEITMTVDPSFLTGNLHKTVSHCFARTACGTRVVGKFP